jgi:hypothetical protein
MFKDPKELKFQHRPFYTKDSGTTTLSASGIIVHDRFIITSGSVITPFLQDRQNYTFDEHDLCISPSLIRGSEIQVYIEGYKKPRTATLCCLVRNSVADKCKIYSH